MKDTASEVVCVIFAKVVSNGWRDDIVGCRIKVPESQYDKAVHSAWHNLHIMPYVGQKQGYKATKGI